MPDDLLAELARLAAQAESTVHIVGGYVRDLLLSREPVDIDLLVEGDPARFLRLLSHAARFEPVVFSRKEPITWRVAMNDWLIDVSSCEPGGLPEAMLRRDFTINALALPLTPELAAGAPISPIDVIGGLKDLHERRLRHIRPEAFDEDPLRMLRAVRLAVVLDGFELDPALATEVRSRASRIMSIPAERILTELEVILASPRAGPALRMMQGMELLYPVFRDLQPLAGLAQNQWHRYDALEHTLRCVEQADLLQAGLPEAGVDARLGLEDAEILKWSALYHDVGKAETRSRDEDGQIHFFGHESVSARHAAASLSRLRVGSRKSERICRLIEHHLRLTQLSSGPVSEKALRRLVNQMKYDTPLLCLLALADRRAGGGPDFEARMQLLTGLVRQVMEIFLRDADSVISPSPLLSGDEVMNILGLAPGPSVGNVMRWLTRLQVESRIRTRDEAAALLRSMPPSRLMTLADEA